MNEKFIIGLKADFELLNICHAANTEKDLFAGSSVEFKNALVTKIVQAR
jgi:hypothetical protein